MCLRSLRSIHRAAHMRLVTCQWLALHIMVGWNPPSPCGLTSNPTPRHSLLFAASMHTEFRPNTSLSTKDCPPAVTLTSRRGTGLCKAVVARSSTGFKPLQRGPWQVGASTAFLLLVFGCTAAALSSCYIASSTKTDKPQIEDSGVEKDRWIR